MPTSDFPASSPPRRGTGEAARVRRLRQGAACTSLVLIATQFLAAVQLSADQGGALGERVGEEIAQAIIAACPAELSDSLKERDACAERLGRSPVLIAASGDTIRWGGAVDGDLRPEANALTKLNALVWRKLYLSLFRYDGAYSMERLDENRTAIRLGISLRQLPPGDFPYPFWHSEEKWRSYQQSSELVLVLFQGRLVAGYRNGATDADRPAVERTWDGQWRWSDQGGEQPRVSLFAYLLSSKNPYRSPLDEAYRALDAAMRPYHCASCHNPGNPSGIDPLMFFTHPAQTLTARHDIVRQVELNKMPPEGIEDDRVRRNLALDAARFARLGDKALRFEQNLARNSRDR